MVLYEWQCTSDLLTLLRAKIGIFLVAPGNNQDINDSGWSRSTTAQRWNTRKGLQINQRVGLKKEGRLYALLSRDTPMFPSLDIRTDAVQARIWFNDEFGIEASILLVFNQEM